METVVTTWSGLMGSCAADFFSGTPTHAAEPSSARIAKLRQEINSSAPLTHTPPPDFNATVAPPEKLADLQHPDAKHLLLGVNLEGLREACELIGFPFQCYKDGFRHDAQWARYSDKYQRKDHPEMAWLDEAYPDTWCLGYDFCCAVKAWLKANGHENESICQVLLKRGSKNVRPANLFYSHTQGVPIGETIRRLREGIEAHKAQLPQATEAAKALAAEQRARLSELNAQIEVTRAAKKDYETYKKLEAEHDELNDAMFPDEAHLFFWLDYTTLKQCVHDFDLSRVRQLIKEIGLTLAELDYDPQAYLARSFCILELLATVQGDAKLLVQMHFFKAFGVAAELAANPVDAKKAQTRRDKDKATIDGFVEAMPGGFERLNATITEAIKKAAVPIAEQFSASGIYLTSKGLTAHDATVVAEILKSNSSVTEVHLNSNKKIGDEGAKALAEALKVNATVKALSLQFCGIGDDGAAALAEALRSNTSLKLLGLRGNLDPRGNHGIGKQGEQLLLDAVAGREGFELELM